MELCNSWRLQCVPHSHINWSNFKVEFDWQQKIWTALWKWINEKVPTKLQNSVAEYPVPSDFRITYKQELDAWIRDGWFILYLDQKLGPPKGLIPLMTIVQQNKLKVRPVMDYYELNSYIEAYTADTDVSASKLWEWHQKGSNVIVGSEEGLSTGAGWQNLKAISDGGVLWQKVLSDQTWMWHCKSWRPSLVLCCLKRRWLKRRCRHNSMTFTSTKMSGQCRTSKQNWHSLAWIARI